MLFNSYQFIFLFLPITWAGYFLLGRFSNWSPVVWLALASLVFYSVSNWQFVALLLASIAFNYVIGSLLIRAKLSSAARFAALTAGVAGDLLVLGYFKYAGFLAANLNALVSTQLTVNILLPVGISFYTFTQIAFLVDAYRGERHQPQPGQFRGCHSSLAGHWRFAVVAHREGRKPCRKSRSGPLDRAAEEADRCLHASQ
jgi:alginate O-acetyltransferase complex protein AlgI